MKFINLLGHPTLQTIAQQHGASAAQIAIAWLLHQEQLIVILKSSSSSHVEENRAALDLRLSLNDLKALEAALKPPSKRVALEVL
jgi:diketogulonate reductase-like aldo/keto reductase